MIEKIKLFFEKYPYFKGMIYGFMFTASFLGVISLSEKEIYNFQFILNIFNSIVLGIAILIESIKTIENK